MNAALIVATAASVASAITINTRVLRHFETESTRSVDILVKLPLDVVSMEQGAAASTSPREFVHEFLQNASMASVAELQSVVGAGVTVKALPIGGAALISGATKMTLDVLTAASAVTYVDLNSNDYSIPEVLSGSNGRDAAAANEWGVEAVGAPEIWKYSTGKGAIVGSIDTGALHTHEAIKANWRSDLGWFDPYKKTAMPWDSQGHGSHTIGTMVGANGIGVAPGAQWIACMGLYEGYGTTEAMLTCAQFMLCPTKADGTGADCKKGPHVVNNSWAADSGYNPWMEDAVAAWKAAGIIPVFANGNAGPKCGSVGNPGGYKTVISVGAMGSYTNEKDKLAFFSSKGPQTTNGASSYVKPDVSAPGFYTRSVGIASNTEYVEMAGTSMAAPHVAGVVALIKSVDSTVSYDQVFKYLTATTDQKDLNTTEPKKWILSDNSKLLGAPNCGGTADASWPNNRFGHGRVNVGTILRDGKLNDSRRPTC
ncbi:hypothetical protein DYB32_005062 [Aphanomyces invadans]|uniref:subtilisin n=1 Tax=Aphanomyces invadans TaxID=157072 RepID=A0A3R6ZQ46_9STRA|nr:hypothetical protein DYB32_005062 [Aphanomyces invadans]